MRVDRLLAQFDFLLFGGALTLALLGVLGVYSASLNTPGNLHLGQLLRVGVGVAVCLLVAYIDYHFLVDRAGLLYSLSILILIGVLVGGTEIHGSKSWINLAGVNFQPSELVKIVFILMLTHVLVENQGEFVSRTRLFTVLALTAVPVALIIMQRDLGTAVMYLPIVAGMLIVSGMRPKVLLALLLIVVVAAPLVWFGLRDYQKQRVLITLDPNLDPQGVGYQTRQSQIAIGSGGLYGRGIGKGLQSQLGFVPESHTDFIFALLAEETGFFGGAAILLLYALLLSRLITVGQRARDRAGILILAGVTSLIFSHVVINVGMALGVLPPIGIPLPLLSYGGSSLLTTFVAVGLALNVAIRRFVYF